MILFPAFVILLIVICIIFRFGCKSTRKAIKNNKYVNIVKESVSKTRDSIHGRLHGRNAKMRYSRDESSNEYSKIV